MGRRGHRQRCPDQRTHVPMPDVPYRSGGCGPSPACAPARSCLSCTTLQRPPPRAVMRIAGVKICDHWERGLMGGETCSSLDSDLLLSLFPTSMKPPPQGRDFVLLITTPLALRIAPSTDQRSICRIFVQHKHCQNRCRQIWEVEELRSLQGSDPDRSPKCEVQRSMIQKVQAPGQTELDGNPHGALIHL